MAFNVEEWRAGMERRYGPSWRDKMREWGSTGGSIKVPKGFGRMDPDKLKALSKKGGHASKRGKKHVAEHI